MTAPRLTLVTRIPDPDPVADLLPVVSVDLYNRVAGLDRTALMHFLGFLCGAVPGLVAEALDITGAGT